jgi:hypothetical protein
LKKRGRKPWSLPEFNRCQRLITTGGRSPHRESGHCISSVRLVSESNAEIWKGKEKSGVSIAPWISAAIIIAVVIIAVERTIIRIVLAMAAMLILTIVSAMAAMLILTIVLSIMPLFLVNVLY